MPDPSGLLIIAIERS